jgi:TonB family protein
MMGLLSIALVLAGQGAPQASAPAPPPGLVRVYVRAPAGDATPAAADLRKSAEDVAVALAGKKKTLTVVEQAGDADVEVAIIDRSVVAPARRRTVILTVIVTTGNQVVDFANKNKPPEGPDGWERAANDIADQIDEWVAARRDEILNRPGNRPTSGGETDVQFDSKGIEFGAWLRTFVAHVKRNWYVPQSVMYQRGRVVVQFDVLKDGTITRVKVATASPIDEFNVAALQALTLVARTSPLPAEYPDDRARFTVTFHYNDR